MAADSFIAQFAAQAVPPCFRPVPCDNVQTDCTAPSQKAAAKRVQKKRPHAVSFSNSLSLIFYIVPYMKWLSSGKFLRSARRQCIPDRRLPGTASDRFECTHYNGSRPLRLSSSSLCCAGKTGCRSPPSGKGNGRTGETLPMPTRACLRPATANTASALPAASSPEPTPIRPDIFRTKACAMGRKTPASAQEWHGADPETSQTDIPCRKSAGRTADRSPAAPPTPRR